MTTNRCRCSSLDNLCPACRAEADAHFAARAAEAVEVQVAAEEAVTYAPDADDVADAALLAFYTADLDDEGELHARRVIARV